MYLFERALENASPGVLPYWDIQKDAALANRFQSLTPVHSGQLKKNPLSARLALSGRR